MGWGNGSCTLKFKPRSGIYSNSTGSCTYDPEAKVAVSYDWWDFIRPYGDKLVYNDYTYSSQTSQHQGAVLSLLRSLGIDTDTLHEVRAPRGINDDGTLQEAWEHWFRRACTMEIELSNPKIRKTDGRMNQFTEAQYEMAQLEAIGCKPLSAKEQKRIRDAMFAEEKERIEFKRKQEQDLANTINKPITELLNQGR